MIMNIKKHNPNYRLVSKFMEIDSKFVNLVYGIDNNNENEGLEVYHYYVNDINSKFYRSYRYTKKIPKKYLVDFNYLKSFIEEVPSGHKLTL